MDMKLGHRKTTLILYLYALVVIRLGLVSAQMAPQHWSSGIGNISGCIGHVALCLAQALGVMGRIAPFIFPCVPAWSMHNPVGRH